MADKKYQIFVSSTYEDLKEERNLIIENILTLGHLPVGMELFCASNDEQFEYIKKIIDDCDYYILILGGRYGSISDKTNLSYTEMEYRYAVEKNIPVLVFQYENIDKLPPNKKDENFDAINGFRDETSKNRVVKFWTTHSDLTAGILVALTKQFQENPRQGWQRFEDKSELMEENIILRKEKDELIKDNKSLLKSIKEAEPEIENIAGLDELYLIKFRDYNPYNREVIISWNEIFTYIGPGLIQANSFISFKELIKNAIRYKSSYSVNTMDDEYPQTIKIQLMAHKLIKVYNAKSVNSGVLEYIRISDKGLFYLQSIKTVKTTKV